MVQATVEVTRDQVSAAYAALMAGDREEIEKYWARDMTWLVPGDNPLSGWYDGLDAFLDFMTQVGSLTGNSFRMDPISIMATGEYSADVTRNRAVRAGGEENAAVPYTQLDIEVCHVLRWRDGKVVEGQGGIFGDGTYEYDQFWSPAGAPTVWWWRNVVARRDPNSANH